jgi:hypothetical protein
MLGIRHLARRPSDNSMARNTFPHSAIAMLFASRAAEEPRNRRPKASDQRRRHLTAKRNEVSTVLSWGAFIGDPPLDTIKERSGFERFSEKGLGTDRDRLIVQSLVSQGRDQDYRGPAALFPKFWYEVQSTQSGHINVGNDTIEEQQAGRRQKRLCRGKRLGAIANGAHQIRQRAAQRVVIIDDCDERAVHRMSPREVRTIVCAQCGEDAIPTELEPPISGRSRQAGVLYSRVAMVIASSPGEAADGAAWQRRVQLNHAFEDAPSQSLECDGKAHTFVWVSSTFTVSGNLPAEERPPTSPVDIGIAAETASQHKKTTTPCPGRWRATAEKRRLFRWAPRRREVKRFAESQ